MSVVLAICAGCATGGPLDAPQTAGPSIPATTEPSAIGAQPDPMNEASPGASASDLTQRPTPPSATSTAAPELSLHPDDQLAQSDAFWEHWVRFLAPQTLDYTYKSIDDLVAGSDLIICGHIADVYVGEEWSFNDVEAPVPLLYARVVLIDVLKGEPQSRQTGTIEVLLQPGTDDILGDLTYPAEDALWFLKSRAKEREMLGRPPASSDVAPYSYFRPNTYQAVIRNIDDKSWPMFPDLVRDSYGMHEFPVDLTGQPFESLVSDVRELSSSGS